ncbi:MAG: hypothetical protein KDD11_07070, partial [Acidobacteria bacterium]|nr:hypothetical protein [Acidobacteriota bacterium]
TPDTEGGLRRRASFAAMATLLRQLAGSTFLGPLPAPEGARLYRFETAGGGETVVGWSTAGTVAARLPRPAVRVVGRSGDELDLETGDEAEVGPSPRYFELGPATGQSKSQG